MKHKYFLPILLLTISLTGCTKVPESNYVNISDVTSLVKIHTDKQLEVLTNENPDEFMGNQSTIYGLRSWSKPNGIHITWNEDNKEGLKAGTYQVYLDNSNAFSSPIIYETDKQEIDIYNLKINQEYYYKVEAVYKKSRGYTETFVSPTRHFTVQDIAPRNIFIDGLENCRDLGGWNIGEGRTYKQGLLYRTVQFNYGGGLNTYKMKPTEYGLWQIQNELKLKTDIDLRKTSAEPFNYDEVNGITSSPLGKDVKYVSAPMDYSGGNIFTNDNNKASIRLVFDTLADINNYPIAFHCLRGTDRTGAIAYAVGALVGMNEKDLMMDYLFSDLANINGMVRESTISGEGFYVQGIANSEGESLSEKAKNYLHTTCDIPFETLDGIINILVA